MTDEERKELGRLRSEQRAWQYERKMMNVKLKRVEARLAQYEGLFKEVHFGIRPQQDEASTITMDDESKKSHDDALNRMKRTSPTKEDESSAANLKSGDERSAANLKSGDDVNGQEGVSSSYGLCDWNCQCTSHNDHIDSDGSDVTGSKEQDQISAANLKEGDAEEEEEKQPSVNEDTKKVGEVVDLCSSSESEEEDVTSYRPQPKKLKLAGMGPPRRRKRDPGSG